MRTIRDVVVNLSDKANFTSFRFYNYFLPQIHVSLSTNTCSRFAIDFEGVEKIDPLTIPNLLATFSAINKKVGRPVELLLSYRPDFLKFLYEFGFFKLLDNLNLAVYDDRFLGGFTGEPYGDFKTLEVFNDPELSQEQIINYVLQKHRKAFCQSFSDEKLARDMAKTLGELMHNSVKWGKSPAYFCAYGGPSVGLKCAVSDAGLGYFLSWKNKPQESVLFPGEGLFQEDKYKHFRAILESIYRRIDHDTYGVCSVIRDVVSLGGTIRFHTGTTQLILTEKNFRKFRDRAGTEEIISEFFGYFKARMKFSDEIKYSPLRIFSEDLTGVHVEYEIPPNYRNRVKGADYV